MTPAYQDDEGLPTGGSEDPTRRGAAGQPGSRRSGGRDAEEDLDATQPLDPSGQRAADAELELDDEGADSFAEATETLGDMTEPLPGSRAPRDTPRSGRTEVVDDDSGTSPELTEVLPDSEVRFESERARTRRAAQATDPDRTEPRPVPTGRREATDVTQKERSETTGKSQATGRTYLVPESEFVSSGGGGSGETTLRRAPGEFIRSEGGEETLIIAGRFEVVQSLGEGGMGKVYLVRDGQIEGRQVALKLLRSKFSSNTQFRTLFFQEIRAAQNFVSEHVVQVRDCGQMEDGKLFLTMDYVPGEDLSALLKRENKLAVRHALEITRQVLLGLHSGHEQGFIHRDIKPGNVILAAHVPKTDDNPMGVGVRLLDFGIAGLVEEMGEGMHAGTPSYMSPEQAKGQRLDPRSDLFAVGIMLYQMVTGQRPFTGKSKKEITSSIVETNLSPIIRELTDVPKPVRKLLEKALAKNRDKRFQSAIDFADAIVESDAYKFVGETSALVKVGLAAMVILAGMEGGFLWKQQEDLKSAKSDASRQALQLNTYQDELRDAKIENGKLAGTIKTLQESSKGSEGLAGVNVATLQRDLNNKDALLASKQTDLDAALASLSAIRTEKLSNETRLKNLEDLYRDQGKELAELKRKASPEGGTANDFDLIFGHVTGGRGEFAAEALSFARNERGSFTKGAGVVFVSGLVGAADQLRQFEKSQRTGPVAPMHVRQARLAFEDATSARVAFIEEVRSGPWLAWSSDPGQKPPDRIEVIESAFGRVSTELEQAEATCQQLEVANRQAILDHPVDADPTPVIEFAKQYGPEVVEEYLAGSLAHYRKLLISDGRLQEDELRNAVQLDTWAEYLTLPTRAPKSAAAEELKLLWLARRWYCFKESPQDLRQPEPPIPELSPGSVRTDWRAQFAIQLAFEHSSTFFPIRPAATLVYRSTSKSGQKTWITDTLATQQDQRAWEIQETIYKDSGDTLSGLTVKIERLGNDYHRGQQRLLGTQELSEEISVSSWNKLPVNELPGAFWSRAIPFAEYKRALERQAEPCLVVKRSSGELWISPKLGIVYEKNDAFTRELVYSGKSQ